MKNFEYKNPVKIIFGKDSIEKLKNEIDKDQKVLIIYGGGSIKKTGVFEQITEELKDFSIFEFGGIEPNPSYENCMKAVDVIKKENIDFLLAAGGGSVIDATKFIAAAACYKKDDPWNIIAEREIVEEALPFGTILTLPATGSEWNSGSVITKKSTKEKLAFGSPLLYPKFSVLDPQRIYTLPDKQVANGITDAYIHVIEQYLTYPSESKVQDRFAEGILQTLIEVGPVVLKNREDYVAAANFMWSASMALNGLIGVGVPQDWSTHMIGHELTALHNIDHARTLAIVLPGVLNLMKESKFEKLVQYGKRVWNLRDMSDDQIVNQAIVKTEKFFNSLGIDTKLSDYNVGDETIDKIVDRFKNRGYKLGENSDITPEIIEKILQSRK